MLILYIILGTIGGLILLVVIIGLLSPRLTNVERSIEINSSEEKVFTQFDNLRSFNVNWSPWTDKDPNMKMTFSGPETGLGARYDWEGNRKVGKGSMEITSVEVNKKVIVRIKFEGMGEADASFGLTKISDEKVKATWGFHKDNGNNPIARVFGLLMDKFMGGDFENGLKKLKIYCEKN